MPIALHNDAKTQRLTEEAFASEDELQACLERCPGLLVAESEPAVATVQREVALPSAGILDLLVVDREGLPVAVEVKLARNAQSRREVVAQAFDYVADLSTLTFDELDDLVDGALAGALQGFVGAEQVPALRKQCAINLRAGRVRLVIAVDAAGEDLVRIVRYITEHSDIDVRLVCVSKFDNGRIIVPRILVAPASDRPFTAGPPGAPKELDPFVAMVVIAYDRTADEDWRTRGGGSSFRQIRPRRWRCGVHYEFLDRRDALGVELHLESAAASPLAASLAPLAGHELLPGFVLQWDQRWSRGRGRLFTMVAKDQSAATGCSAMQALIQRTRAVVEDHVARLKPTP